MRTLAIYAWLLFAFCGAAFIAPTPARGADSTTVARDEAAHTVTITIVLDTTQADADAKAKTAPAGIGPADPIMRYWETVRGKAFTALDKLFTAAKKTNAEIDAEAAAIKARIDAEAAAIKASRVALPDPTK